MKRAEWGVVASICTSIATMIFTVGFVYGEVQDHGRRLLIVEAKSDAMQTTMARIDANVSFLADRAKEDRATILDRERR
ncbi:hypothetical protein [Sphingomonas paeninsulae]|nr:hypothetical protein [Sphingomonas paeninsulae]